MTIKIITGDCRDILKTLATESVHCVVCSPPYWGLRDYGVVGQLGMETSLGEYVDVMVEVFREVRRVLRKDGTLWLNLGEVYAAGKTGRYDGYNPTRVNGSTSHKVFETINNRRVPDGLKPKDLCGVPWRVAFALQADGWYLRQDIIWSKPNPMPESVTDRCTKAHEYLFLLAKSERYYYDADAIKEAAADSVIARADYKVGGINRDASRNDGDIGSRQSFSDFANGRNKRSVWEIATAPFAEAHFATFPPALIEPCIKAGTSERGCCAKCGAPWMRMIEKGALHPTSDRGTQEYNPIKSDSSGLVMASNRNRDGHKPGMAFEYNTIGWHPTCLCVGDNPNVGVVPCTVLDPFAGAGTTGLVADRLQRGAILIELNPDYSAMSERRIVGDAPLFVDVRPNAYNATDDFARSIDECYRAIRERKANGGKGWGGWE